MTDVIELHIADEEKTGQRNLYKYEQLHDLQSRLMLVAGKAEKGKDDVDRFMLVSLIYIASKLNSWFPVGNRSKGNFLYLGGYLVFFLLSQYI